MKRKLIELGGSTFVSLPSKYIKANNLQKGQEIEIEQKDNNIVVSTTPITTEITRNIDVKDLHKIGKRFVTALYRKGTDHIKIKYEGINALRSIKKIITTDTIGYEIIKQDNEYIEIKDFSVRDTKEYNQIVRRMWLILLENCEEVLRCFKEKDHEQLELVKLRDKDINKFSNFCCRLIFKGSLGNFEKSVIMYNFLRNLESLSDEFKELSIYVKEEKIKVNKQSIIVLEKVINTLKTLYEIFYKFDINKLNNIAITVRKIDKEIKEIFGKKDIGSRQNIYLIAMLKKIDQLASNMVELN